MQREEGAVHSLSERGLCSPDVDCAIPLVVEDAKTIYVAWGRIPPHLDTRWGTRPTKLI